MLKRMLATAAVLAVAVLIASAQTPQAQTVSRMVARLTRQLDLTASQQAEATQIFTPGQNAAATLGSSLENAHAALENAITGNDASAIAAQAAQIGSLTGQQVQARATAVAAFYAILTADQRSKYSTLGPLLGAGGFDEAGGPHGAGGSH